MQKSNTLKLFGILCLGLVLLGCPTDVPDPSDTTAPAAGGAISVSDLSTSSLKLAWSAAVDETDSALSYKVVSASTSEAINTASEIDAVTGDGVVKDWASDIVTAALSGLTPKTTYFVNVAVKDKAGNLAAYTPVRVTTLPEKLYLFNVGMHDGNLGGRSGADKIVSDYTGKPAGVTVTVAFLSVSASDQLCDIPANYNFPTTVPIYEPDGIGKIADNWADLIDGSIDKSLSDLEVLPGGKENSFWSGSNEDGTFCAKSDYDDTPITNCKAWTDASGVTMGMLGDPDFLLSGWLHAFEDDGSWKYYVLGLGY